MSMTQEQALKLLERPIYKWSMDWDEREDGLNYTEAIEIAIAALRPVSREQVEKVWRGEWITKHYVDGILEGTNFDECSKCGYQRVFENPELKTKYMFCPGCGCAMWDEAVEMVMERLEALYGQENT